MSTFDPPLRPRKGLVLLVLIIARISTVHQDRRSLSEQQALCKRYVAQHYSGTVEWHVIESQGSGEILDRKELFDAEALVESGRFDLVIVEDLARICRRNRAVDFCELCEDNSTRLIAINDHIDTGREDWRLNAFFATMKHEMSNKDTSARIIRSLRERFVAGGVFQFAIYGYIKPAGAENDDEVAKDKAAEPIYDQWFRMLEDGASYAEVADWLERQGVPVGPYCEPPWTGRKVQRVTFNPILKGERQRNNKESKRVNKTGRRRSVDAPPERRLTRYCEHLAFIEPARYDRVIRLLRSKNDKYTRGRKNGVDTRKGVSRKRTAWPGQAVVCGVCGRLFYWGGHGQAEHMMCSGARDWRCWNGSTFDGVQGARLFYKAILERIETLPDFAPTFLAMVRRDLAADIDGREQQLARLGDEQAKVQKLIDRTTGLVIQTDHGIPSLLDKLAELQGQKDHLLEERDLLERRPRQVIDLPSIDQIKREMRETLEMLSGNSPEFGRRMQRLVPSIKVYPYRLVDGGKVVLRAKLTLTLAPLVEGQISQEVVAKYEEHFRHELMVDLFEPPQRVEYREQVVALRGQGHTEKQVALKLGLTATAAQRAAALQRLMEEHNLTDPYVLATEPPADCTKLRRHQNPRYRFDPLDGYPDW